MQSCYKDLENAVSYFYARGHVLLFDSNEILLKETRHSFLPKNINLKELIYKVDYKFFVGEDRGIFVVVDEKQFMDIGMYKVIGAIHAENYLLTDANDKFRKLWFPQSAQKRYNDLIKLCAV
jgi:hypothetical protein